MAGELLIRLLDRAGRVRTEQPKVLAALTQMMETVQREPRLRLTLRSLL
jgi:hypothetical protein